jgi:hypothetical protein
VGKLRIILKRDNLENDNGRVREADQSLEDEDEGTYSRNLHRVTWKEGSS